MPWRPVLTDDQPSRQECDACEPDGGRDLGGGSRLHHRTRAVDLLWTALAEVKLSQDWLAAEAFPPWHSSHFAEGSKAGGWRDSVPGPPQEASRNP